MYSPRGPKRPTSPRELPYQCSGRTSHTSRAQQAPESARRSPREPVRMWLGELKSKRGGHHGLPLTSRLPSSGRHLSTHGDEMEAFFDCRLYRHYPKAEALEGGKPVQIKRCRSAGLGGADVAAPTRQAGNQMPECGRQCVHVALDSATLCAAMQVHPGPGARPGALHSSGCSVY